MKYADLEDIDDSGKDVYETEDTPSHLNKDFDYDSEDDFGLVQGAQQSTEDIETHRLDTDAARQRFRGSRLEGGDFSNKLVDRRRNTQKYPRVLPESNYYEFLPRGYTSTKKLTTNGHAGETVEARIRRLRVELDELEVDLERNESVPVDTSLNKAGVNALIEQLRSMRGDFSRLALSSTAKSTEAQSPFPAIAGPSKPALTNPNTTLVSMASQLDNLERLIGSLASSSEPDLPSGLPIISTLSKVEAQLNLLTQPRHLDTLNRRIKVLLTDLDRIHETRRKMGDTTPLNVALPSGLVVNVQGQESAATYTAPKLDKEANIDLPANLQPRLQALFALLPRMQALMPVVQPLLLRLRTLADLHASAADFDAGLTDAEQQLATLSDTATSLQTVLGRLESSFNENQAIMQRNMDAFQQRLDKISTASSKS